MMNVRNVSEIEALQAKAKGVKRRILVGKGNGSEEFVMRYFEMEKGGHGFVHHHDWGHGIFVVGGQARLTIGDEECDIKKGDTFYIPPNKTHTMKNTGDETFVFICTIPGYANEEERVFLEE